MDLKEAHDFLAHAYGIRIENGNVAGIDAVDVPKKVDVQNYSDLFAAWQAVADHLSH